MSDNEVHAIIIRLDALEESFKMLGKRLGFLERTLYTFAGGISVIAFLLATGYLKLGN